MIKCENISPSLYKETQGVSLYREESKFSHLIIYFRYRMSDSCAITCNKDICLGTFFITSEAQSRGYECMKF